MERILLTINYGGALVDTVITPEDGLLGTIYSIQLNGQYTFTLYQDEDGEWSLVKEQDATIPFVEMELLNKIIKKLQYELRYAA